MFDNPLLEFWVSGFPRPKGSLKLTSDVGSTKVHVREQIDPAGRWRGAMYRAAWVAAQEAGRHVPFDFPLAMRCLFLFNRPMEPEFDLPATTRTGDIDKLARNAFDALSPTRAPEKARVAIDDSRYVGLWVEADYARSDESEGVFIQVFRGKSADRSAFDAWREARVSISKDLDKGVFG